ncbi:MAG TPA: GNAT family N-acetyltransferase [Acidimicrobiales bacterium]|nr:GNAT family N-acetyltransferase [Acidimicrobiales bacterium]
MTIAPVRVVAAEASLGEHRAAWDALVERAPLPSPFLRSWWLEHTCRGEPIFVLLIEGGALVGGLALQERTTFGLLRIELMGSGPLAPDHLDVVAEPGREGDVAAAVHDWLADRNAGVVDFLGLAEQAHAAGCIDHVTAQLVDERAPYLELPADWATLLTSRSSRVRNTVKRTAKRLARDGVTHRTLGADDADTALDDLERLHRERWGAESSFLGEYARFRAAAAEGMARGELVVHELVAPDGPIASMAIMHVGGRASFYQSGRSTDPRWRGAGTIVFTDAIEAAIAAGCTEFDLLRGGETYKADWSSGERDVVRIIGSTGRRRIPARALGATVAGRRWLRPHVRHAQDLARQARARLSGKRGTDAAPASTNGSST